MRVCIFTLVPLLLGIVALASTPTTPQSRDITLNSTLNARAEGDEDLLTTLRKGHGDRYNRCRNNPLRDPYDECRCKPGLVDLMGSCCCGDTKNTVLTLQGCREGGGCDEPVCECNANHAEYDIEQMKCVCEPGYHPKYKRRGQLKCKPDTSPSGIPKYDRRQLAEAIHERRYDTVEVVSRSLEDIMRCLPNERACQMGPAYACIEVMSNLAACGACPSDADDCASLPGVNEVRCDQGKCVIDSCLRGYTLRSQNILANSTAPASFCEKNKPSGSWFVQKNNQGGL